MRLTADLIQSSLSYLNPLKERELDLRGHKIPAVENLGVAGPHDMQSISQINDIQFLGNFPLSPRLRTLLLARNRVSSISPTLSNSLPNLTTLVLTRRSITENGFSSGVQTNCSAHLLNHLLLHQRSWASNPVLSTQPAPPMAHPHPQLLKSYRVKLTEKERKKVEELIKNAKSLQEIIKLEKELNEGRVPAAAQGDDLMEE
ncbi:hypothetical protein DID88_003145 [Monilinia fructigena]|uniref:U2 small nuclear ribonucleoprotein A' n=1 Tax=Monilinia fructigena TaxID=38457 RepID=A0A395IUH5_9HELO|nr:hypothetical protein DID88_003145 [Monilinia fructigena]